MPTVNFSALLPLVTVFSVSVRQYRNNRQLAMQQLPTIG